MNKNLKWLFTIIFFVVCFVIPPVFADQPPDPGGGPGSGDPPVGGGSPVGGGLVYLLIMGAVYGYNKLRLLMKNDIQ
jgi:hypothetical protein